MVLNLKRAVPERLCAFWSKTVPLVIANSNSGLIHHQGKGYHPQCFTVVPNGIDTARFQYDQNLRTLTRAEFGVLSDQILVGVIARLDPMKDHATFLKAAALVAREIKNVKFLCVGAGAEEYTKDLQLQTERLGLQDRLVWLGERHDMPAVYNALDLLVSSSAYGEGFPNVIGEAMASGVPCVVTDVGDSAKIVARSDYVVPPRDHEKLAAAICTALKAKNEGSGCSSGWRERIVNEYSVQKMIELTETHINQVLKRF